MGMFFTGLAVVTVAVIGFVALGVHLVQLTAGCA